MGERGSTALQQNRPITQAIPIPMGHSICPRIRNRDVGGEIFLEGFSLRCC